MLVASLGDQVDVLEGGPRIAGEMLALGLVDEFFHTVAPMAISGDSARLAHGFCDDAGYLFPPLLASLNHATRRVSLGAIDRSA